MEKNLELIKKLLELTSFLEEEYSFEGTDAYPPFVEGTARKCYYYLYSLERLSSDEKNGDAVIDLSRSLLESMIVVLYVQTFGAEEKAKKFFLFAPIEAWEDGEYAIAAKIKLPQEAVEARKKERDELKGDYLRPSKKELAEKEATRALKILEKLGLKLSDVQQAKLVDQYTEGKSDEEIINKTWVGTDLESMMNQLAEKGKFPGNLKESFDRIYAFGNRKNHLSPIDIDMLIGSKERIVRNQKYHMSIGLYVSLLSYTMIIIDLADLRKDDELKKKLVEIKEKLLSQAVEKSENELL